METLLVIGAIVVALVWVLRDYRKLKAKTAPKAVASSAEPVASATSIAAASTPAATLSELTEMPAALKPDVELRYPALIEFTYFGDDSKLTTHQVGVSRVGEHGFTGYCHQQCALREFRYDRVVGKISDQDTGEVRRPGAWRRAVIRRADEAVVLKQMRAAAPITPAASLVPLRPAASESRSAVPKPVGSTGARRGTKALVASDGDGSAKVQASISFDYIDAQGELTTRTVDVSSISRYHIQGYCHMRGAQRTFRHDGIVGDITDMETGEILSPSAWRRSARAQARPQRRKAYGAEAV